MLFGQLENMFGPFKFPAMKFPVMKFPKMDMSKAGAEEDMTATTTHCVNNVCNSKVIHCNETCTHIKLASSFHFFDKSTFAMARLTRLHFFPPPHVAPVQTLSSHFTTPASATKK